MESKIVKLSKFPKKGVWILLFWKNNGGLNFTAGPGSESLPYFKMGKPDSENISYFREISQSRSGPDSENTSYFKENLIIPGIRSSPDCEIIPYIREIWWNRTLFSKGNWPFKHQYYWYHCKCTVIWPTDVDISCEQTCINVMLNIHIKCMCTHESKNIKTNHIAYFCVCFKLKLWCYVENDPCMKVENSCSKLNIVVLLCNVPFLFYFTTCHLTFFGVRSFSVKSATTWLVCSMLSWHFQTVQSSKLWWKDIVC